MKKKKRARRIRKMKTKTVQVPVVAGMKFQHAFGDKGVTHALVDPIMIKPPNMKTVTFTVRGIAPYVQNNGYPWCMGIPIGKTP